MIAEASINISTDALSMRTFCKFIVSCTLLSLSLFIQANQAPLCESGSCNIEIQYENGGSITSDGVFLSFGENASLYIGENGSYDLGSGGYFTGITETEFLTPTPISSEAVIYLGEGASLNFSNGGYVQFGIGGNISPSDIGKTNITDASNFIIHEDSNANITTGNLIANATLNLNAQDVISVSDEATQSSRIVIDSDNIEFHANSISVQGVMSVRGDMIINAVDIYLINSTVASENQNIETTTSADVVLSGSSEISEALIDLNFATPAEDQQPIPDHIYLDSAGLSDHTIDAPTLGAINIDSHSTNNLEVGEVSLIPIDATCLQPNEAINDTAANTSNRAYVELEMHSCSRIEDNTKNEVESNGSVVSSNVDQQSNNDKAGPLSPWLLLLIFYTSFKRRP